MTIERRLAHAGSQVRARSLGIRLRAESGTATRRESGRSPVPERGLEHTSGEPLSRPATAIES